MHRTHWLIFGVGCGVATLYLMVGAWQDIAFVSSGAARAAAATQPAARQS